MAVSYVTSNSNKSTTTSLAITGLSGIQDGDIIIAHISSFRSSSNSPGVITSSSGFTEIAQRTTSRPRSAIFYKIAASEGGSPTYTWTSTNATQMQGSIGIYRGCLPTSGCIDVYSDTAYITSNTNVRGASVTPTRANGMFIYGGWYYLVGSVTLANPTGMNSRQEQRNTSNAERLSDLEFTTIAASGIKDGIANANATVKHAFIIALKSKELQIDLVQITETETSQAIGSRKDLGVPQSTETDIPFKLTSTKNLFPAQSTEADSTFALTINKRKELGQATETDVGFAVGKGAGIVQSTETDSVFEIGVRKSKLLDYAVETDSTFNITYTPPSLETKYIDVATAFPATEPLYDIDGNQVYDVDGNPIYVLTDFNTSKTDQAQKTTIQKRYDFDYAEETDSVFNIVKSGSEPKYIDVGTAFPEYEYLYDSEGNQILDSEGNPIILPTDFNTSKTDFALGVTVGISGLQFASETDTPFAIAIVKYKEIAFAEETDSVFNIGKTKYLEVPQVEETDESQEILQKHYILVGIAEEQDEAMTFNQVNYASEFNTAFSITAQKPISVGQATETDEAQLFLITRKKLLDQITETDLAGGITVEKQKQITRADEADESYLISVLSQYGIIAATETDEANPVFSGGTKFRDILTATEIDSSITVRPFDINKLAKCVRGKATDYDLDAEITYYQTATVEDYKVEATVGICAEV